MISKAAQKLLARVRNPNRFYRCKYPMPGRCMQELIDAGLVESGGRVNVVVACYVPVGTTPFHPEQFPAFPGETQ